MPIKEVELKPTEPTVLKTEKSHGLKFAVVFEDKVVIALFDSEYWAKRFIEKATTISGMTVREVA